LAIKTGLLRFAVNESIGGFKPLLCRIRRNIHGGSVCLSPSSALALGARRRGGAPRASQEHGLAL
jgi:hypothetical protein